MRGQAGGSRPRGDRRARPGDDTLRSEAGPAAWIAGSSPAMTQGGGAGRVENAPPARYVAGSFSWRVAVTRRAGSADLPLHNGRVPPWLAERMAKLGAVIAAAIVHHYGRDELLRRLAHPFWFQSFGAVMGMDWHSSGITTSVIGALKRGLKPQAGELGLHVCGGR